MRRMLVLSLVILCFACKKEDQPATAKDPVELLPASNEITGWTRSGQTDSVRTDSALTALLGAAAQPYTSNGFSKLARQFFEGEIADSTVRLELRIADMADTTHARLIYAALARAGQTAWTGDNPGDEARFLTDSLFYEVNFRYGQYFFWLRIESALPLAREVCRRFAVVAGAKADTDAVLPPEPKDPIELLPTNNEIGGWNTSGPVKTAENQQQLYDLIDGEGVPYVEHGFVRCAFQDYTGSPSGTTVDLNLRIFDMADSTNARGVYGAVATGVEVPWTGDNAGDEARIEQQLFSYRVDFRDGRYYVWVTIQENSDAALLVAKLFCRNISQAIRQ